MAATVFPVPRDHRLDEDLAIIQNGTTATTSIAAGSWVSWNGILKKALSAISSGDTLSSTNLGDPTNGVLNDLNSKINSNTLLSGSHHGYGIFTTVKTWDAYRAFIPFPKADSRSITITEAKYYTSSGSSNVPTFTHTDYDCGIIIECTSGDVSGKMVSVIFTST